MDKEKLLAEREKLVSQVEARKAKGPDSKSAASLKFFEEDLIALAKKILTIDKKLGRV